MDPLTIGIDIGGTNFRIGTVNRNGAVDHFEKHSSRMFDDGNVVEVLAHAVIGYMERCGVTQYVKAVGVGVPSIVSRDKQTILSTPNLKGFDDLRFADALGEKLGLPVFLDRDVNFLLLHDIRQLGLDPAKTILGFYVGTGFGNALYLEGHLYAGKNGAAGELGHIPLFGLEERCTCGNFGCSEVRCSGRYLEHLAETHFPGTKIRNVFKAHPNHPILLEYVRNLAIPIAAEINILDPDHAVLAGGVLAMLDFPKEILLESIRARLRRPYPAQNADIRFTEHTQESGVCGSGLFAAARIQSNIEEKRKSV